MTKVFCNAAILLAAVSTIIGLAQRTHSSRDKQYRDFVAGMSGGADRGLLWYVDELGPELGRALAKMGKDGHWIDGGTGAGFAGSEFVSANDEKELADQFKKGFSGTYSGSKAIDNVADIMKLSPTDRGKFGYIRLSQTSYLPFTDDRIVAVG